MNQPVQVVGICSFYHEARPRSHSQLVRWFCATPHPSDADPVPDDFVTDAGATIFRDAYEILKSDPQWLEATTKFIAENIPDTPERKVQAICAVSRLAAIGEELYRKKVIEKPFWVVPAITTRVSHHSPLTRLSWECLMGVS